MPSKIERYMYCQKDSQNKTTFQVEKKRRPQCDSTLNIKPVFLVDAVSFSSSVVAMWYKWCRMEVNCSVPVYVINAIVGRCWFVEVDRTVDCLFIQSYYMLEGIVN